MSIVISWLREQFTGVQNSPAVTKTLPLRLSVLRYLRPAFSRVRTVPWTMP